MKKSYVKPEMNVESFLDNSYCSTCTSGESYEFLCNTDSGNGRYYYIFEESNGQTGLQTSGYNQDKQVYYNYGGFTGCGETHTASTADDFKPGYITNSRKDGVKQVMIWYEGSGGTNANGHVDIHVTDNLNKESWTIVKS